MTDSAAQGLPAQDSPQGLPAQGLIARRLNHLFETVRPPGRGPYSLREVVEAINQDTGTKLLSAAYLSQLRTGQRTEPSHSRLAAIAKFFGVDIRYFSDEQTARATDEQLEFLAAMRDSGVRAVAIRAAGLSDTALEAVKALIDNARRLEGLDGLGTSIAPPSTTETSAKTSGTA